MNSPLGDTVTIVVPSGEPALSVVQRKNSVRMSVSNHPTQNPTSLALAQARKVIMIPVRDISGSDDLSSGEDGDFDMYSDHEDSENSQGNSEDVPHLEEKKLFLKSCRPYQVTAEELRSLHRHARKRNKDMVNIWLSHYYRDRGFLVPTALRQAYTIESKEQWWVETLSLSQTGTILKHNRGHREVWTAYIKAKHEELCRDTYVNLRGSSLYGISVPTLTGNKAREARKLSTADFLAQHEARWTCDSGGPEQYNRRVEHLRRRYVQYCVATFDVTHDQLKTCERLNVCRGDSIWDWTAEIEPQELKRDQERYQDCLINDVVPDTPHWLPWVVDKRGTTVPGLLTVEDVAAGVCPGN